MRGKKRILQVFNCNKIGFCDFVFDALKDRIVQILIVAALVSIIVHMIQGKDKSLGINKFNKRLD